MKGVAFRGHYKCQLTWEAATAWQTHPQTLAALRHQLGGVIPASPLARTVLKSQSFQLALGWFAVFSVAESLEQTVEM